MCSFISNFHNLLILKNEARKHANVKVIFSKKITLSRKWRHCSFEFCWIFSNLILKIWKKSKCNNVFDLKLISQLVFENELDKKGKKNLHFQNQPGSIYIIYYIWVTKPQGLVMCSSLCFFSTSGLCFFSS